MNTKEIFAKRITQLREQSGLKRTEAARKLRISPQSLEQWESGVPKYNYDLITRIAKLYNVDPNYLFGYE